MTMRRELWTTLLALGLSALPAWAQVSIEVSPLRVELKAQAGRHDDAGDHHHQYRRRAGSRPRRAVRLVPVARWIAAVHRGHRHDVFGHGMDARLRRRSK